MVKHEDPHHHLLQWIDVELKSFFLLDGRPIQRELRRKRNPCLKDGILMAFLFLWHFFEITLRYLASDNEYFKVEIKYKYNIIKYE